ncbi:MAG: hypothetical protein IIV97_02295 [Oscillospiraceae bacterium]|nr:hypothetical protein [Oscillospiraceae bacterium]
MESTDELSSIRDLLAAKRKGGEKYWEKTAKFWTCPETVLDHNVSLDAQPYSMPQAHVADGCYVGVVSVANFDKEGNGVWNSVHAELAWSPDAKNWNYIDKGNPFIKNAEKFALEAGNDYGMIYSAAPVNVGNRTDIFYSATAELHYIAYDEIPDDIKKIVDEKIPKAAEKRAVTRTSTLKIARIPKDRYAAIWAESGTVTTNTFSVSGEKLVVTADVCEGGCVKIEVSGSDGMVIDGYSADDFDVITENITEKNVSWGGKDLSALCGREVSFRILLENAGVYTIGGEIKRI